MKFTHIFDPLVEDSLRGIASLIFAGFFLAFSNNVQSENRCETSATPTNPFAAVHSGIGGTGVQITQSGIGGTGIENSGIGGTGIEVSGIGGTGDKMTDEGGIGGTGIIGIITGFASICVNGIEIHYDANTPITMNGSPSSIHDLATGQVVVVRADEFSDNVIAQQIAIMHAAVGPITHIDPVTNEIQVLNQTIQLQAQNVPESLDSEWVRISGHRLANGKVVASHIQSIQPLDQSIINGRITQINSDELVIDGTRVALDPQTWPTSLSTGMEVSVSGHWNGASIHAQAIQIEPTRHILENVEYIVIEGYVQAVENQLLSINNQSVAISPATQFDNTALEKLQLNQRIQVTGHVSADNQFIANKVELNPEPLIHEINLYEIDNNSEQDANTRDSTAEKRQEDEPARIRQNMHNDNQKKDDDINSEKSRHTPETDAEKKTENRDPDISENSATHDEDSAYLEQDDAPASFRVIQQDLDRDATGDQSEDTGSGHDSDWNNAADNDINLDHEQNFENDPSPDFDRALDHDFNQDFDSDLDRQIGDDFDRDFDHDFGRDNDGDFDNDFDRDFGDEFNQHFDRDFEQDFDRDFAQ